MKLAFINTWRGGAVYNVTKPIADMLDHMGHDVDYFTLADVEQLRLQNNFDPTFSDYDAVHFTYFPNMQAFYEEIGVPYSAGVHHIPAIHLQKYASGLAMWAPFKIVVSNPFTAIQLGQVGVTDVSIIPYAFDHSKFPRMPYPEEFTVGYMGGNYETKRFWLIDKACEMADLPLKTFVRDSAEDDSKDFEPHERILDFYKSISCYAVSSFDEGGPLPPQEALLCGRPVVSTHVGMMPQILEDGVNGRFHSGSPTDIANVLLEVKDKFTWYSMNARATELPNLELAAEEWEKMFKSMVDD